MSFYITCDMHKSNDFFAHVCNSKNKLQNKESGAVGDDFVQVVKPVFRSWYIQMLRIKMAQTFKNQSMQP